MKGERMALNNSKALKDLTSYLASVSILQTLTSCESLLASTSDSALAAPSFSMPSMTPSSSSTCTAQHSRAGGGGMADERKRKKTNK
jgi:hypothetical protein